jgi:hypothetical protein
MSGVFTRQGEDGERQADIGSMVPQANAIGHKKLNRAREDFPLGLSEEAWPLEHL